MSQELDQHIKNAKVEASSDLHEFTERLLNVWLPAYCNDEKRKYSEKGFNIRSMKVSAADARDFIRALDNNIVLDTGGGRYRMPQSKAIEVIFWEGAKKTIPRPITLWLEPIITIAAMARLHLDYGWPISYLGTQSEMWEFDIIAFKPNDLKNEYIAGEVKKSSKELDVLIHYMKDICSDGSLDNGSVPKEKRNAYKKCLGLRRCKAPFFWALGPDNDSRLFKVEYHADGSITFKIISDDNLYWN